MPIVNTREGDPRWGYLQGLGAAAAVPPTDQFAGWPSLEAKRAAQEEIKKSIRAADEAIYGAARNAPGIWEKLKGFVISPLTSFLSADTRNRVAMAVRDRVDQWELFKKTLWEAANHGTITADGVARSMTPDEAKRLLNVISRQIVLMQDAVELSNSVTVGALLQTAAKSTVEGILERFKKAGDTVNAALDAIMALLKGAAETVKKAGEWLEYLPYILVGGIVLFYVVPTVLKARREGSAGLEADLRAGRSRIESGARAAGSAAVKAGKAGAAAYTGNPALLMSGSPRIRRRR
jgi:hypothetical protein